MQGPKVLNIRWQRLVSDGSTCDRCSSTEDEVEEAVRKLEAALPNLGVEVNLEKESLTKEDFKENPKASNRIFLNDVPIEDLIGAEVGGSECCDVCGDEECRTVIIDGEEHEVVSSETIVSAAIKAVNDLSSTSGCCNSRKGNDDCSC